MENKNLSELGLREQNSQISNKGDGFTKIYANNIEMNVTHWDMSLIFGEIVGEEGDKPIVEQKVKVNMSKEFTKALLNLLTVNIAAYEKQYGEITVIPTSKTELTKEQLVLASAKKRQKG
jgi:Protein of unknown function (DUF3467)